ncbi:MAG: hypothetical protein WCA06_00930 [Terrimicrobiaceae bacterium]
MANSIEQVAAGVLVFGSIGGCIAAIIGFVVLCERIKDWFLGVPRLSKKQLDRTAMWRLRQIGEGRMDARTACVAIPSEADLLAAEAAFQQEVEQAKREIAAKKEAAPPAQPEIAPQDIAFEDGKAILSPHVHVEMPVSTMRLTFQGGETLDIRSNLEFVGLDEEGFRVAYAAFTKTQLELGGLKGSPPPLNSKFWRERGL